MKKYADSRRFKTLRIANEMLVALLSMDGSRAIKIDGMPPDAEIKSATLDLLGRDTLLRIWSNDFDPVSDAGVIPEMTLTCSAVEISERTA